MKTVQVALEFREEVKCASQWYKNITCHMIFGVKMDFARNVLFFSGGH